MQDIQQNFLRNSVQTLRHFQLVIEGEDDISEQFFRQLFRQIHTLKGTARAFGLDVPAVIAHEIETLLEVSGTHMRNPDLRSNLIEGLQLLIDSLETKNPQLPEDFVSRVRSAVPDSEPAKTVFLSIIPHEVFEQLTEFEKNKIAAVLQDKKSLYSMEAVFSIKDFSEKLSELQKSLVEKGEIIFTLPGENAKDPDQISFHLYFSSLEEVENLERIAEQFGARLIGQTSTTNFSNDLGGILSQIVYQAKNLARSLGKNAKISILSDEPKLNADNLKLIFDVLLHLINNSIVHSFEKEGTIDIRIKEESEGILIIVADDGQGIDLEKVRRKAIEKDLIPPNAQLSERETLELIFIPGFSTAEKVTEAAGRGIGLDAVRDFVINAGGSIGIESQKGAGTTFEIFLPV